MIHFLPMKARFSWDPEVRAFGITVGDFHDGD
jgi:hypothetical protein